MNVRSLIHKLFELQVVKFGTFQLKSGVQSPIYIDLRRTISYPKLLVAIAEVMHEKMRDCQYDLVCGVPYTALPFATALSIQHSIPMVMRRKEKKEYGTGQMIEGVFEPGQRCLVIEDVITSGQSILETAAPLQQAGLIVQDAVVLVDREQGGVKRLKEQSIQVHTICTLTQIIDELLHVRAIDHKTAVSVQQFIKDNQHA